MAAMVAPQQHHHQGMWDSQRRNAPVMHMNSLPMSSMVPASSAPSTPTSRSYQSNYMESQMPMYTPTSVAGQVSYPASNYSFDMNSMNQYPVQQQQFNMNFQPSQVSHPASYPPASTDISAPVPLVRDARNALPQITRSPPVKTELPSPARAAGQHNGNSGSVEVKPESADTKEGGTFFSTEVDVLMRAIQSKQKDSEPSTPAPIPEPQQKVVQPESRTKLRKKYHCTMPGCHKSFFQKTHLEIHVRAHTGAKPFVSIPFLQS